ncbi:hypothetical protein UFOVP65_33 [uncultured Caudovirales phage]|jgi:hypothetical protein|uniref:Uncharacterized protein n=1 Tax=uncultured Caudovirales phage TaxID=2100421 RepID=A0A6J5KUL6_9CAUD|nr:hypothetical protein [Polynucleobacter sp. UB-Piko-W3]MBU3554854.1 hypothetical protein [Polynucleobacter sp. UB-Piko-W3]CAB4124815.1 hypothetical protein UFOVP65_33 [uncultured Caudovirales phage]
MNQKKAKALRKIARSLTSHLPEHVFKEMGINTHVTDGVQSKVTAPLTVAADTKRGQYVALKRVVQEQYRK